jgi:hypothetical protein
LHVVDYSIGDDETNTVLLLELSLLLEVPLYKPVDHLDNTVELGVAPELNFLDSVEISGDDSVDTVAFGLEDVAVEGEAMRAA